MTTVRSPRHRIGRRGFQMLMDVLDGKAVESFQLSPELVLRTSS